MGNKGSYVIKLKKQHKTLFCLSNRIIYQNKHLFCPSGDSSFTYSNGAQFSTKDYGPRSSCSYQRQSGWWHHYCTWINPNGIYVTPGTSATSPSGWAGVVHVPWKGFHSMAVTKLMFRRN